MRSPKVELRAIAGGNEKHLKGPKHFQCERFSSFYQRKTCSRVATFEVMKDGHVLSPLSTGNAHGLLQCSNFYEDLHYPARDCCTFRKFIYWPSHFKRLVKMPSMCLTTKGKRREYLMNSSKKGTGVHVCNYSCPEQYMRNLILMAP